MKRRRKLMLAAGMLSALFAMCSCQNGQTVVEADIKSYGESEVLIGEFDLSKYYITRVHANGETDEIPVTEDMISDYEKLKFLEPGKQSIEVDYLGAKLYITVTMVRNTFDVTMDSASFTYDGKSHSLSIDGYYPSSTEIDWPNGNSFTGVGTYDVTAVLSNDNYVTKTINSTLTITYADYDMSDITFKDQTITYDGEEHRMAISGELPDDVSVSYSINAESGNTATNAGTYIVVASFSSDNTNYNTIASMKATLTINKADVDTDDYTVGDQDVKYQEGQTYEWTITNTLPSWITVKYVCYIRTDSSSYVHTTTGDYVLTHSGEGDYREMTDGTYMAFTNGNYVKTDGKYYSLNNEDAYVEDENGTYVKVLMSYYTQTDIGYRDMVCKFTVSNTNYNAIPDKIFEICLYTD